MDWFKNCQGWLVSAVLLTTTVAGQQPAEQGVQRKIQYPEYDRVTGQLKSMLLGKSARRQANGLVLVREMRLETFVYDERRKLVDLVVESPACLFNFRTRVVSSPYVVKAWKQDGSSEMTGRGFRWHQRTSSLIISNSVRTISVEKHSLHENTKSE